MTVQVLNIELQLDCNLVAQPRASHFNIVKNSLKVATGGAIVKWCIQGGHERGGCDMYLTLGIVHQTSHSTTV